MNGKRERKRKEWEKYEKNIALKDEVIGSWVGGEKEEKRKKKRKRKKTEERGGKRRKEEKTK